MLAGDLENVEGSRKMYHHAVKKDYTNFKMQSF
jgi:hypothetical protein